MKIIFYTPGLAMGKGGAERVCVNLAHWLIKRGHEPIIFFNHYVTDTPSYELDGSIPRYPLGQHIRSTRNLPRLDDVACVCNFFYSNYIATPLVLADHYKAPLVISEHNIGWQIEQHMADPCRRSEFHRTGDKITLLSHQFRNYIKPEYLEKTCIIPNAIHDFPETGKSDAKKLKILSIGRFHERQKRFSILIRAFAILAGKFPDWTLELIGEGEDGPGYKKMVADLNLRDRIHFTGKVENVFPHYQSASLFCLASSHEGMSMAMLESQGCGLPYVGFACCKGVEDVIENGFNGLLAPEFTPESLADTLAKVMADAELRKKLSSGANIRAREFSEDKIFAKWEALFYEMEGLKGNTTLQKILMEGSPEEKARMRYLMSGENEKNFQSQYFKNTVNLLKKRIGKKP